MSLLNLNRHHSCPLYFDFHGQLLKVEDQNGKPYFTAETIGKALGYAYPREAIMKIYERNKAEFGDDETILIEKIILVSETEQRSQIDYAVQEENPESRSQIDYGSQRNRSAHSKKQIVRLFSLRGAYHFGFFAKTKLGREFRQWVLDLIEARHEEGTYYAAFRDVVGVLSDKYPLWKQVHLKFTRNTPLFIIADELNVPVSRVSRAIRQMRDYKVLTDREYHYYRTESRKYANILRGIRKQRGA